MHGSIAIECVLRNHSHFSPATPAVELLRAIALLGIEGEKSESSPAGFGFDGLHQLGSQRGAPAPAMDHDLGNVGPVGLVGCPGWVDLNRPDDAQGIPG